MTLPHGHSFWLSLPIPLIVLTVNVPLFLLFRLELWPGFITSILQYESNVMLCADVSHKIIRMDTVLDLFYDIHGQRPSDFHEACVRAIVGEIVLTRFELIWFYVTSFIPVKHLFTIFVIFIFYPVDITTVLIVSMILIGPRTHGVSLPSLMEQKPTSKIIIKRYGHGNYH